MSVDTHKDEVARLAAELEHQHPIRMQMFAVVILAALGGFLAAFLMLHMGLTSMPIRYAIATIVGYGIFVVSVRTWLLGSDAASLRDDRGSGSNGWNLNGLGNFGGKTASKAGDALFQGGRSGGGGASAAFDTGSTPMLAMAAAQPIPSADAGSGLGKMKIGGKGKDVLPLLVMALIAIGIAVVGRVVWQSPSLIAEMLVDGAVAGSALRGVQRAHHNRDIDVITHTWVPALIVFALMVAIGAAGQFLKPEAISIGDLFR